MPKERHYVPHELILNQEIFLEEGEFHHLITVMRTSVGETIELVNGLGALAKATVRNIQKKRALLHVDFVSHMQKETSQIILAQAIPRLNRLDFIIEKGTELGMTHLWLFPGAHGEKKTLSATQMERLQHLAIAAMKQSGRLFLPEISILPPVEKWTKPEIPLYFGSFAPNSPSLLQVMQKNSTHSGIFCVGPESGFTAAEEDVLRKIGGIATTLNRNTLRTETAAIAALAVMAQLLNSNLQLS